jgi:hypothetical protein
VIALRGDGDDRWQGRYLRHAPGPADTARLLRQIVTTRYRGRRRYESAVRELIGAHPAGWASLGTGTRKDPVPAARRAPAPAGTCLCHEPDGSLRPALLDAALAALPQPQFLRPRPESRPCGQYPADGSPWLIERGQFLPAGIHHVFVLYTDVLEIRARDGAREHQFIPAFHLPWDQAEADWDALDQRCAAIRARTKAHLAAERTAEILADTAKQLAAIPPHADLVLHLLGTASRYLAIPPHATPEAALARAADIHTADLPGHLLRLGRSDQIALLRTAAHHLDPALHPQAQPTPDPSRKRSDGDPHDSDTTSPGRALLPAAPGTTPQHDSAPP